MASAPPSVNSKTTLVEMDPVSCLCSSQHPTNIMTGVITRLLREHFSNVDNLIYTKDFDGRSGMEALVWNADSRETKIQIQPVWDYNTQDIERRPAIYTKRNEWQTQRYAIDDGYTINAKPAQDGSIERVEGEYKARAVIGSHTIFCVGREGAEAELIGSEVFDFLMSFASVFRKDFKLHKFEVNGIGPISMLQESHQHFVVPVVVAYAAFWAWRLEMIAPWFQKLAIDNEVRK